MGKPKVKRVFTEEERAIVKRMAAVGITHEEIAKFLRVNKSRMVAEFRDELDTSAMQANAAVAGALYKNALKGNVAAQIFWTKAKMGWRERDQQEGKGNGTQTIEVNVNVSEKKVPPKKVEAIDVEKKED